MKLKSMSLTVILLISSSFSPQTVTSFSLFPFPLPIPFSLPFSLPSTFGGIIGRDNNSELARRCFPDLGDGEACMAEIFGSFFNRQITIGPECCKAIVEIDEDCTQAVFKQFRDFLFTSSVKQFCSYINS
ncbi:hypothetical protein Bca101_060960 [Brassica carinata]